MLVLLDDDLKLKLEALQHERTSLQARISKAIKEKKYDDLEQLTEEDLALAAQEQALIQKAKCTKLACPDETSVREQSAGCNTFMFAGSRVCHGRCRMLVLRVGERTAICKSMPTPVQSSPSGGGCTLQ